MAKTRFICTNCKTTFPKWQGRCSNCGEWGTVEEDTTPQTVTASLSAAQTNRLARSTTNASAVQVTKIPTGTDTNRIPTGIPELDRVFGGGIVPGAAILLAGSPGSGKSTLLQHVAKKLADQNRTVLYVSGEENETQIKTRSSRIGAESENIWVLSESNADNITSEIQKLNPNLVIVDSIQTLLSSNSEGRVGSPSQVTEIANLFTQLAKQNNIPVIMIGHLTKNDSIAGPRVVEHLVDVVLYLEANPDTSLRMLRGVKNRHGSTDEVGLFMHTSEGLEEVSVTDELFTNHHETDTTGFAVTLTVEGIRVLPVEIQALVTNTRMPNPRKITQGLEHGRALQIQAVLDKYISNLRLQEQDVYVSTVGGMKINDTGADLAVAASLMSSRLGSPMSSEQAFIGEVTLTGEIRPARDNQKRVREALRIFNQVYVAANTKPVDVPEGKTLYRLKTIKDLAQAVKDMNPVLRSKS